MTYMMLKSSHNEELNKEGRMQLMNKLTEVEQEKCENVKGMFNTLTEKFEAQYTEIMLSVQYCKLIRKTDESKIYEV